MDKTRVDLLDNEREWRRYLIEKVDAIEDVFGVHSNEIAQIKVWNLVFRILGAGLFAIVLVWLETTIK